VGLDLHIHMEGIIIVIIVKKSKVIFILLFAAIFIDVQADCGHMDSVCNPKIWHGKHHSCADKSQATQSQNYFNSMKTLQSNLKTKTTAYETQLTKTLPNEMKAALTKAYNTLYDEYKLTYNLALKSQNNKITTINITEAECEGELQMPLTKVPKKKYGWYCGPMWMYGTSSSKTICDDVCEGIGQHYAGAYKSGFHQNSCSMDYLHKVQKDCKKNSWGDIAGCGGAFAPRFGLRAKTKEGHKSAPAVHKGRATSLWDMPGMPGMPGETAPAKCCWRSEMSCKCWRWGKQSLSNFEPPAPKPKVCQSGAKCSVGVEQNYRCGKGSTCLIRYGGSATCVDGAQCGANVEGSKATCSDGAKCWARHRGNIDCSGNTTKCYVANHDSQGPGGPATATCSNHASCWMHSGGSATCTDGAQCGANVEGSKATCSDGAECWARHKGHIDCSGNGTKCYIASSDSKGPGGPATATCSNQASCDVYSGGSAICNKGSYCTTKGSNAHITCKSGSGCTITAGNGYCESGANCAVADSGHCTGPGCGW
jgi:hypothetical protein